MQEAPGQNATLQAAVREGLASGVAGPMRDLQASWWGKVLHRLPARIMRTFTSTGCAANFLFYSLQPLPRLPVDTVCCVVFMPTCLPFARSPLLL